MVALGVAPIACSSSDDGAPATSSSTATGGPSTTAAPSTTAPSEEAVAIATEAVLAADPDAEIVRVVAQDGLVAVHAQVGGDPGLAIVRIFEVDDGIATEEWSVAQPITGPNASGHTMLDGGGDPSADADIAANTALVQRLYDEVFTAGDLDAATEILAEDYVQHSPLLPDGREALLSALAGGQLDPEVQFVVAQGDLVAVAVSYGGLPAVDIFRIEDGRIAEHWDVLGAP